MVLAHMDEVRPRAKARRSVRNHRRFAMFEFPLDAAEMPVTLGPKAGFSEYRQKLRSTHRLRKVLKLREVCGLKFAGKTVRFLTS